VDVGKREDQMLDYISLKLEEIADLKALIAIMEADK
jgi:hypothetical protein